jgi:hypothetical protein
MGILLGLLGIAGLFLIAYQLGKTFEKKFNFNNASKTSGSDGEDCTSKCSNALSKRVNKCRAKNVLDLARGRTITAQDRYRNIMIAAGIFLAAAAAALIIPVAGEIIFGIALGAYAAMMVMAAVYLGRLHEAQSNENSLRQDLNRRQQEEDLAINDLMSHCSADEARRCINSLPACQG